MTHIRTIQPSDNAEICKVIRQVLEEVGVPKVGTAYEDKALKDMYQAYNEPRMKYFVVEDQGSILGGAGIAPLANGADDVCELQKMYFLPNARGKGLGYKMISTCLDFAKSQDFKKCYLETMPYMVEARKLYKKVGFNAIDHPMGNTGHYNCQAWMIKTL